MHIMKKILLLFAIATIFIACKEENKDNLIDNSPQNIEARLQTANVFENLDFEYSFEDNTLLYSYDNLSEVVQQGIIAIGDTGENQDELFFDFNSYNYFLIPALEPANPKLIQLENESKQYTIRAVTNSEDITELSTGGDEGWYFCECTPAIPGDCKARLDYYCCGAPKKISCVGDASSCSETKYSDECTGYLESPILEIEDGVIIQVPLSVNEAVHM